MCIYTHYICNELRVTEIVYNCVYIVYKWFLYNIYILQGLCMFHLNFIRTQDTRFKRLPVLTWQLRQAVPQQDLGTSRGGYLSPTGPALALGWLHFHSVLIIDFARLWPPETIQKGIFLPNGSQHYWQSPRLLPTGPHPVSPPPQIWVVPRMDLALLFKFTVFCEHSLLPFLICPSLESRQGIEFKELFCWWRNTGTKRLSGFIRSPRA